MGKKKSTIKSNKKEDKNPNIREKIILKPFRDFNIKPKKDINIMNSQELKEFAHKFDINPEINYKLLSDLMKKEPNEYCKYIDKYKYTLNFQDAIKLECFDKNEIVLIINEFNNNIVKYKIDTQRIDSINDIKIFSKIKIFNLLVFISTKKFKPMNYKDIEKKISSYSIPQTLIFKTPNKYGNYELLYYTYLIIIINNLLPGIVKDNNENNSNNDYDFTSSPKKGIFFNFCLPEKAEKIEVNLEEFYKRKKLLDNYIKDVNLKETTSGNNFSKKINEEKYEVDEKNKFLDKIDVIRHFLQNINELISLTNENDILERIRFIIRLLIFHKDNNVFLTQFSNCLKINNYSQEDIASNEDDLDEETKNNFKANNYKDIVFSNFDNKFDVNKNNPFYNKVKYFSFPYLNKMNILENDNDIFNSFKNFLKYIYTSDLIKDIYYLTHEFDDFAFPFENNDILDEIFDMTFFLPFPSKPLAGFTIKEVPEILISVKLFQDNPTSHDFSSIVCQFSQMLNTCLHEHLKHYLEALIFYNSFPIGMNKRINSNLYEIDEERQYINSILKKNKKSYDIGLDGGEKAEIFLYGDILRKIYFGQSLELFKMSNWKKDIPSHIKNFIKCRESKSKGKIEFYELEKISNDNDLCEFYKILADKFKQFVHNKNEDKIIYNYSAYSAKGSLNNSFEGMEEYLIYDNTCFITTNRGLYRDSTY